MIELLRSALRWLATQVRRWRRRDETLFPTRFPLVFGEEGEE